MLQCRMHHSIARIVLYCTVLYCTSLNVKYHPVESALSPCCTELQQQSTLLHYIILYCVIQYYNVLCVRGPHQYVRVTAALHNDHEVEHLPLALTQLVAVTHFENTRENQNSFSGITVI